MQEDWSEQNSGGDGGHDLAKVVFLNCADQGHIIEPPLVNSLKLFICVCALDVQSLGV